ncbi:hypothetical protein M3202_17560 [Alkalihalobacillus oceani]|uniref:Uncharacterized protein n=1 Tax=Halalkalibacter oceani TaxID=1653776 RepID=A0A9X2IQG9_9BACI|nr:hypothetical protein [Halalkalibacter oceani]MCM3715866.1 hypothetical protein [Halalkalibacter oceani]
MSQQVIRQEDLTQGDIVERNISKLKGWLENLKISHIISYDDEWEKIDGSSYKESIKIHLEKELVDFLEDFVIQCSTEETDALEDEEVETVEDLLNIKAGSKLINLQERVLETFSLDRKIMPLEVLKVMLEKICEDSSVVFQTVSNLKLEEVAQKEGRILFLLDMNMEETGLSKDVIIDTITSIKQYRKNNFDLAIVYSHENLDSYKHHQSKVTYIEEYMRKNPSVIKGDTEFSKSQFKYLFAYQLWGINKTNQKEELVDSFLQTIEKAAFGYSLHDYLDSRVSLTQQATSELINMPEERFELLLQDSFIEGERFVDILNRTHNSLLKKMEYQRLNSDSNYLNIIKNIISVARTRDELLIDKIGQQQVIKYSKNEIAKKIESGSFKDFSEFNILDYGINSIYENISTGDLFQITLHGEQVPKYAVLISASCDLPLRFPKFVTDSVNRNENSVVLCLYDNIEVERVVHDLKDPKKSEELIWPIKVDENYYVLKPCKQIITLEDKLLDLCSLNLKGIAHLNKNLIKFSRPYKSYHFQKYLEETLEPWIDSIKNIHYYIENATKLGDLKESELLPTLAGLKYNVKMNFEKDEFDLVRIGRLDKELTLKIIQGNISNLSRIGLEKVPFR